MKFNKDHLIITVFAVLHFAVALGCRLIGIADDLILTLLTMLLVVIICFRRPTSVTFMAVSVILVNILGFALGKGTAALIALFAGSPLVIYPLSTFVSTEVIGWGWLAAAIAYSDNHPAKVENASSRSLRWLLVAFVVIIVVRMILLFSTHDISDSGNMTIGILLDYVFSCGALVWVAEYAISSSQKARASEADAKLAEYRYLKLKQQVNPHFLFNSLNILDCLIQEKNQEKASEYIHKLADIYRYMLHNEEKDLVSLKEEMEFVKKYVDLLYVRWPEGLDVRVNIGNESLERNVIPCSVQLLIENAIKHNAVLPDKKLAIDIHTTDKSVVVSNNLHPKYSETPSTGLGLKYIRQRYKDLSGKVVIVRPGDDSFTVILPFV